MSGNGSLESLSDEALVALHRQDPHGRDGRAAVAVLVERWSQRTYHWAHRFVREREQALDLAQDALLQMIQALPRYQPRGRFSAWLFTIVHNRCLDWLRRERHARTADVDLEGLVAEGPGPEARVEIESERERTLAAMRDHLEPVERLALWMRAEEGTSVDDITRILGLDGASGARGVLQTARRKLRAALGIVREGREEP